MALNRNGRIAVFASLGEATGLIWQHRLPYLVLVYLTILPMLAAALLGLLEPFQDFAAIAEISDPAVFEERFGRFNRIWAALSIAGYAISIAFAIFWFRYLLLGREGALKLSLGRFNGVFWRSAWRGLAVGLLWVILLFLLVIPSAMLGTLLVQLLGGVGAPIFLFILIAAYLLPFALAIRLSLVFPALAVERRLPFSASWSAIRGSTWRVVGAILLFVIPFVIVLQAINVGLFWLNFGQSLKGAQPDPAMVNELTASMFETFWLAGIVLAPLSGLPMAFILALVAIAYRDLTRGGAAGTSAEAPAGASFAT